MIIDDFWTRIVLNLVKNFAIFFFHTWKKRSSLSLSYPHTHLTFTNCTQKLSTHEMTYFSFIAVLMGFDPSANRVRENIVFRNFPSCGNEWH